MRTRILVSALPVLLIASCGQPGQDEAARSPVVAPSSPNAAATSAPSAAASASPAPTELGCSYPVNGNKDTAASVLARFGNDAKRENLPGVEGMGAKGIVLWGNDPSRRIELTIDDESAQERIASLSVSGTGSKWRVAGIGMGSSLAQVVAVNGRAFKFWGFEWDYGGYVSDFKGGKLERLEGGCDLTLRLGYTSDGASIDESLLGDTAVQSDEPKLGKLKLTVDDLGLNWR